MVSIILTTRLRMVGGWRPALPSLRRFSIMERVLRRYDERVGISLLEVVLAN